MTYTVFKSLTLTFSKNRYRKIVVTDFLHELEQISTLIILCSIIGNLNT